MSTLTPSPGGPIKPLLKSWSEASGRTIKTVTEETAVVGGSFSGQFLVFRFSDGSGLILKYDEDDGGYSGDPDPLNADYSVRDGRARVYFGIDSLAEYLKAEEQAAARYNAEAAAQERATFDRLKLKYEGR